MAADGSLALTGVDGRSEQRAKLEYKVAPKDILVFVPGTTDPVNMTDAQHDANKTYWDENKDLRFQIANLRKEFLDLHVCMEWYSWSGDNAQAERVKAGGRLRELLYARKTQPPVYAGWKDRPVWLHLIGHSHGGNVINEFTKQIKGDFPKKWKIKSVTYLSTPFFKKLHQLDTTHFHPECRVLNVYNTFDITQRVIADFTMQQMPGIIKRVKECPAVGEVKQGFSEFITALNGLKQWGAIDDKTQGPAIWRNTIASFETIKKGLKGISELIEILSKDFPDVLPDKPKQTLVAFVESLISWCSAAITSFRARLAGTVSRWKDHYNTNHFIDDTRIGLLLAAINAFLAFNPATYRGRFFDTLDQILLGRIDVVDDTTNTPQAQVPSQYKIHHIPVKEHDHYNMLREREYARFIGRAEALQAQYVGGGSQKVRMEFLLLLVAQLPQIKYADWGVNILDGLDYIISDDSIEVPLKALVVTLKNYRDQFKARACNIVYPPHLEVKDMEKQYGSLAYLAKVSHSVSRRDLYPEVRDALIPAFGSGKNPAYKVSVQK